MPQVARTLGSKGRRESFAGCSSDVPMYLPSDRALRTVGPHPRSKARSAMKRVRHRATKHQPTTTGVNGSEAATPITPHPGRSLQFASSVAPSTMNRGTPPARDGAYSSRAGSTPPRRGLARRGSLRHQLSHRPRQVTLLFVCGRYHSRLQTRQVVAYLPDTGEDLRIRCTIQGMVVG